MKNVSKLGLVAALALTAGSAFTLLVQHPAAVADQTMNHTQMSVTAGNITISGVAARFLLEGRPGAVFFTIDNKGEADRIVAASSPLTDRVELHTHTMSDGVMKMRQIEAIDVAAGGKTELKSSCNSLPRSAWAENSSQRSSQPRLWELRLATMAARAAPMAPM